MAHNSSRKTVDSVERRIQARSSSVDDERPEAARNLARLADSNAFSESEQVRSDSIHKSTWHWLWKETVARLTLYQHAVNEGKDLDAALAFARYVIWSKLVDVLKPHDCEGFLKVDSAFLQWKAEELQRSVQDVYLAGKSAPQGDQSHLEAISRKLDAIAGRLAQVPIEPPSQTPALRVVS